MALIACPECRKDVSSTAAACPSCGAPIHALPQGNNAMASANICPVCGKMLMPKATICANCNVNVKNGRPLKLPSLEQHRRTPGRKPFGLLLAMAVLLLIGYWQRDVIRELFMKHGTTKVQEHVAPEGSASNLPPEPHRPLIRPSEQPSGVDLASESGSSTQPASVPSLPPQPSTPTRAPQPVERRVLKAVKTVVTTCALCKGEGRLLEPGSQRWTYPCPPCSGSGKRVLRIETGQTVCASCNGMGKTARLDDFRRANNRYVADHCNACRGTGIR